jgi:anti-sigma factor RsiW
VERSRDIDLMRYFDGELGADEARALEAELDDEARAKLAALGSLREGVRTHLELEADDAEPALAGMWARVEQRLQASGDPAHPGRRPEQARPRAEAGSGDEPGLWAAIARFFDRHRGHFVTGAVTAGAVAALVLILRPPPEQVVVERIVTAPARPVEAVPARATPPEIESLEVNDGAGTVITLAGDGEESPVAVIWITPDESNVEGPI